MYQGKLLTPPAHNSSMFLLSFIVLLLRLPPSNRYSNGIRTRLRSHLTSIHSLGDVTNKFLLNLKLVCKLDDLW
jgi:hypothetical protein